jgi:hypothetical protein
LSLSSLVDCQVDMADDQLRGLHPPVEQPDGTSATSHLSSDKISDDELPKSQSDDITALARQLSALSEAADAAGVGGGGAAVDFVDALDDRLDDADPPPNPFIPSAAHPDLDPLDPRFDHRQWLRALLRFVARDRQRYPPRAAGVSWRRLSVWGHGSAADYQRTVANVWLALAGSVWATVFRRRRRVRIDILRNFEGLVRSGEMLVVLGRPGR